MEKIVITGATSFLGKSLVQELLGRNCQIYALIRPSSSSADLFRDVPGVTTILAEMGDTDQWIAAIGQADYFLHLGWGGTGVVGRANDEIQQKNITDTLKCFKGAHLLGCKVFFFAGSQAEYGLKHEQIREDTHCEPVTPYGTAKNQVWKQASHLAQELKMCYYHARIFSIYGPGDHPHTMVSDCIRKLQHGRYIELSSCQQYWNYLYITDAAKMIIGLLFSGAPAGIYNVASQDTRRLKEFVMEIYRACGNQGELRFGTRVSAEQPPDLQPDISKVLKVIPPLTFTPFHSAIKELVEDALS